MNKFPQKLDGPALIRPGFVAGGEKILEPEERPRDPLRWINIEAEDGGCHPRAMRPPGNEAPVAGPGLFLLRGGYQQISQFIGAADDELKPAERVLGLRVSPLLSEIMYSDLSVSVCHTPPQER